jgi:hypothetical protein
MVKKRVIECLVFLPEVVCHEFADWCIFEQAKAATIDWLRRDNLMDLAQMIEDASDYQTLSDASKTVGKLIDDMWPSDVKAILQLRDRIQAFRAATATETAIWFAWKEEFRSPNIAGTTIRAVAIDEATQQLGQEDQDRKLLEICLSHGVDVNKLCNQNAH